MERGLLTAAGIGLALFGGLFFVYFAVEFALGGDGKIEPGVYAGLIVFFGGMLASGIFLIWRSSKVRPSAGKARPGGAGSAASPTGAAGDGRRGAGRQDRSPSSPPDQDESDRPPADAAERERRVLRLAEREHGRLTVTEVSAHCGLTIAEAKTELDRLVTAEVAELQVTPGGVLVYTFPGFLSDEEKRRAVDF
jgi:hypothetical protein